MSARNLPVLKLIMIRWIAHVDVLTRAHTFPLLRFMHIIKLVCETFKKEKDNRMLNRNLLMLQKSQMHFHLPRASIYYTDS